MWKYKVNRLFIKIIIIFAIGSSISNSQTIESSTTENINQPQYLQIGFINETALYYHSPIGSLLSIKSGISLVWNYSDETDGDGNRNYERSYYPYKEKLVRKENGLNSNYNISLSSILFYQITNNEYAKIHFGAGISIMNSYQKISGGYKEYTDTTIYTNSNEVISKIFGIGPSMSLMIASHIYERLSIVSEYNFTANYNWNSNDNSYFSYSKDPYSATPSYTTSNSHIESNGWGLKFSNVRVGLLITLN